MSSLSPARPRLAAESHFAVGAPVMQSPEVVSPFDPDGSETEFEPLTNEQLKEIDKLNPLKGPLPLTLENVELVLDRLRPYLMADGGNVEVREIEGPIVKLELKGNCGTCMSSAMTLKMGLERGLKEKIPEIFAVEQVMEDSPELTEEGIEEVLEGVRPFLKIAGGTVQLVDLNKASVAPTAMLKITGASSTINSVRVEIASRIKRNFPTLANIVWEE